MARTCIKLTWDSVLANSKEAAAEKELDRIGVRAFGEAAFRHARKDMKDIRTGSSKTIECLAAAWKGKQAIFGLPS